MRSSRGIVLLLALFGMVWLGYAVVLAFGPIEYREVATLEGLFWVVACLAAWAAGLIVVARRPFVPRTHACPSDALARKIIAGGAAIGVVGAVALLAFKGGMGSGGLEALTEARYRANAEGAGAGGAKVFAALVAASAGMTAMLYYFATTARLGTIADIAGHVSLVCPAAIAVAYGGRWPMVIGYGLVLILIVLRKVAGEVPFPSRLSAVVLVALLPLAAFRYVSQVSELRAAFTGAVDVAAVTEAALVIVDARIRPEWNQQLAALEPTTRGGIVTAMLYATHGVPIALRLRREWTMSPFWGQYHGYLLALVGSKLSAAWTGAQQIDSALDGTGVLGLYNSALGAMIIDFGSDGAWLAMFCIGAFSAWGVRWATTPPRPGGRILLAFLILWVVTSPVQSLPSISNTPIIMAMVAFVECALWISAIGPAGTSLPHAEGRQSHANTNWRHEV